MGSNRLDLYEVAKLAFYKSQPQWRCGTDEATRNLIKQQMVLVINALIVEQEGPINKDTPFADLGTEQRTLDKLLGFEGDEQVAQTDSTSISKTLHNITNEMRAAIVMGRVMQQTQQTSIAH